MTDKEENMATDGELDTTGYRSVDWTLTNRTGDTLVFSNSTFESGRWDGNPPSYVPDGTSAKYSVCSRDGALYGVEGTAMWRLQKRTERTFHFKFSNPFSGSNSFVISVPEPEFRYRIVGSTGGNHASFEIIFEKN